MQDFSKQFPDDGGGVTERKETESEMRVVSERLGARGVLLKLFLPAAAADECGVFLTPLQRALHCSFFFRVIM